MRLGLGEAANLLRMGHWKPGFRRTIALNLPANLICFHQLSKGTRWLMLGGLAEPPCALGEAWGLQILSLPLILNPPAPMAAETHPFLPEDEMQY